jgi:glycosyltransferase involved in cell wall biosynthesis
MGQLMGLKIGVVICSRIKSSRIKNKPLQTLGNEDISLIEHLIKSLSDLKYPVFLAVPDGDLNQYHKTIKGKYKNLNYFTGHGDNPLKRMLDCSEFHKLDYIVRICHDKVFLDCALIEKFVSHAIEFNLSYIFSSSFIQGTGFEVIEYNALKRASIEFRDFNVEHISYSIKKVCGTDKILNYPVTYDIDSKYPTLSYRFLVDYLDDLLLLYYLFVDLKENCNLVNAIKKVDEVPHYYFLNRLPKFTIYTCVYNGAEFIKQCIESVLKLNNFNLNCEYIIIDDCSNDKTPEILDLYKDYNNVKVIRNKSNVGLSSSSNIALNESKGDFIIRLDADDFFIRYDAITAMENKIENDDVVYPSYLFGEQSVKRGDELHHVGGSLFRKSVINFFKFTEGLRNYEGLDFFEKSRKYLKRKYVDDVVFYYRQHSDSMSHTNKEEREQTKKKIFSKYGRG